MLCMSPSHLGGTISGSEQDNGIAEGFIFHIQAQLSLVFFLGDYYETYNYFIKELSEKCSASVSSG